jgi:hypothetical protein
MARRQALFRLDPGLLFVAAGLVMCAAAVLLPAQRDLHELQQQLRELQRQDELMQAKLRVTAEVRRELERGDPLVHRRLATSQLNLAPAGDTPIVLVMSQQPGLTQWIDARARRERGGRGERGGRSAVPTPSAWPDSRLSRLLSGPHRLHILGGSVLCVFIGLLLGTSAAIRRAAERENEHRAVERSDWSADERVDDDGTAGVGAMALSALVPEHDEDFVICDIATFSQDEHDRPHLATTNVPGEPAAESSQPDASDDRSFPRSLFDG